MKSAGKAVTKAAKSGKEDGNEGQSWIAQAIQAVKLIGKADASRDVKAAHMFSALDKDQSGTLERGEVRDALQYLAGKPVEEGQFNAIWS